MVDIDNKCGTNWISRRPRIMPFCIIMLALDNSCPTVQKGNSALGFRKSGHQLMLYIDYKTLIAKKESGAIYVALLKFQCRFATFFSFLNMYQSNIAQLQGRNLIR